MHAFIGWVIDIPPRHSIKFTPVSSIPRTVPGRAGLSEMAALSVVLELHWVGGTLEHTRLAEKAYSRGS